MVTKRYVDFLRQDLSFDAMVLNLRFHYFQKHLTLTISLELFKTEYSYVAYEFLLTSVFIWFYDLFLPLDIHLRILPTFNNI